MTKGNAAWRLGLLMFALVALFALLGCATLTAGPAQTSSPTVGIPNGTAGIDPDSRLPWISILELPPQAAGTLALIDSDGPFPYEQDGAVFQNREGILPDRATGYYHEYTVETPGSPDRGARRIVAGSEGELYWTDDHYDSFSRIQR